MTTDNETNAGNTETVEEVSAENAISDIEGILNKTDESETDESETDVSEQDKKPDESADEKVLEESYEEVNPAIATPFVEAAKTAGWNETDIRSYIGTHTDNELVNLTNSLTSGERSIAEKQKPKTLELDEALLEQLGLGDEGKGALKKLLTPIMSELDSKSKELEEFKAKFQNIEKSEKAGIGVQRFQVADDMFDAAADELSSLGKTKDLPRLPNGDLAMDNPQVKNREKVFNLAYTLAESGSYSFKNAMKIALDSYRGSTAEKEFKNNFIRKLKKGETRLSAKGQQTQATVKYKTDREEGIAAVKEAFRKSGVEVPT